MTGSPSTTLTSLGTSRRGRPHLVTVAHGTRRPGGNETAREITARAGELLGTPSTAAYVELSSPLLSDVVGHVGTALVVPLLLSTGFHVRHDVPEACAGVRHAVVGRSLGPHRRLAAVQVQRLREAGAAPGSPVVMVAAGSRDTGAARDLRRATTLLSRAWGAPVRLATLDGAGRRPAEVVRPGDAVSPYLLSPGLFSRRVAEQAEDLGAHACADVLGAHEEVVTLVAERARTLTHLLGPARSA